MKDGKKSTAFKISDAIDQFNKTGEDGLELFKQVGNVTQV